MALLYPEITTRAIVLFVLLSGQCCARGDIQDNIRLRPGMEVVKVTGCSDAMATATLSVFLLLLAYGHCGKDKPVFSDEINEIIQSIHNACVGNTGVSEEDIANCEKGIFKEDNKLKCYMFCLLEEASLADEDGVVDYDMMLSLIPEEYYERASSMILGCKHHDTPNKDKCQNAFDVQKCSYEKDPDIYFLF